MWSRVPDSGARKSRVSDTRPILERLGNSKNIHSKMDDSGHNKRCGLTERSAMPDKSTPITLPAPPGIGCTDLLGLSSNTEKSGFNAHDKTDGKEEWLTPPEIIKALGDFDLDPCSPTEETRPWATAKAHYSIVDNGLIKPWHGRVWCNPPYGGETNRWMKRCADHRNVTALIFARTETQQFFESIWPKATAVCFIKGRLSFYHVSGKKGGTAGAPSMLVTWDDDNANALWDAVCHGRIKGAFVDLRGGRVTP